MSPPASSPEGVVLYYPEYDREVTTSALLEVPLPVLHVAAALLAAGFPVEIVDGRIGGAHERLRALEQRPLFFGISCFMGQIADGYAAATILSERFEGLPVVCGGWLPTTLPELFQDTERIDALVRGPAEVIAPVLARRLAGGEGLGGIPGVAPRNGAGGFDLSTGSGPSAPPCLDLPFHLLELEHYELMEGRVDLLASRGCPLQCTFCAMASVYRGGWFPRSGEEIVDALGSLAQRFELERVQFYDDSFFTEPGRVLRMARGLVERGPELRWMAAANLPDLATLRAEDWDLLARSGCATLSSGIESGSAAVRRRLGKSFDNASVLEVARHMQRAGIRFAPFFIIGLPDESEEELEATFELASELLAIDPENHRHFSIFLYFPMPATPLFRMEKGRGVLDGFPVDVATLRRIAPESHWGQTPWVPRKGFPAGYRDRRRVVMRSFCFWTTNLCPGLLLPRANRLLDRLRRSVLAVMRARVRARFFRLPLEWCLYRTAWALRRWLRPATASETWRRPL